MIVHKSCRVCGRRFGWRKKWAKNWAQVRYCSDTCRRRGLRPSDRRLEVSIPKVLAKLPAGATLCESELARQIESDDVRLRALREPIRMAARRLYHAGKIELMAADRKVDADQVRGPIRLRRPVSAIQAR